MSLFIFRHALWVFPFPFLHFHIFKTRLGKASLPQNSLGLSFLVPADTVHPPGDQVLLQNPKDRTGPHTSGVATHGTSPGNGLTLLPPLGVSNVRSLGVAVVKPVSPRFLRRSLV